jgi:hypothetical protein
VDWYKTCGKYHKQTFRHDARLDSLPTEWQRELAALWRLEADVNTSGYLIFLANWGRESYVYASQALTKMGAKKMAAIVDKCQALVDKYCDPETMAAGRFVPNAVINKDGDITKEAGSTLPDRVVQRIHGLSR